LEGTLNIILDIMQFKLIEKEKDKKKGRSFWQATNNVPLWKPSLLKSTLPSGFLGNYLC